MKPFTHPCTKEASIERVWKQYQLYGNLVIGYDFDNTVFDTHKKGGDYSCVIDLLVECSKLGFVMCLYTAEPDEDVLKKKIKYCKKLGINVDFVNESPILNTKKPYFNVLLDDTAGLAEAYEILSTIVDKIKSK